ncbi:2-oxo acid dehydrogenase subunit E2 [Candidatus Karelsulcia muelleri]|uniref:Dihydrolipoamide acetyltransferase component of pyruvate dehydrogenase complex n=1 Tax=Candidatus Karelsulcia muelleri TaxID=336810 RepID=A0A3A1MM37_9FLAO|nr:2-oxo acid dehydrogenase subunit E2 [Candidatus Karelsulcia muelleri]RIU85700.1 dihydrolipoamide acyltransferase [Candidatus Karelsulcia muelleri]
MAEVIFMPRLSDTMVVGTVVKWHKKIGDKILEGDILAEIETDKAIQELEAEYNSTLLYIGIKEGESAPVNSVLAILGSENEDISSLLKQNQINNNYKRILISPLAKQLAFDKGISLDNNKIKGTGINGRILKKDIERYIDHNLDDNNLDSKNLDDKNSNNLDYKNLDYKNLDYKNLDDKNLDDKNLDDKNLYDKNLDSKNLDDKNLDDKNLDDKNLDDKNLDYKNLDYKNLDDKKTNSSNEVNHSNIRKIISKRLINSKIESPHYSLFIEVIMDDLIKLRDSINEKKYLYKISFNDLIVKASALAIKENPKINSSWTEKSILYHNNINIGIAVALEDGLIVPVINQVNEKSLRQISFEIKEKVIKAKEKKIQSNELEGSTFTVSNLGMFGIDSFTSIINQPNSCILSVGSIKKNPIINNDKIVIGHTTKFTLTCDHRMIDGAVGSDYLKSLKNLLQEPLNIII